MRIHEPTDASEVRIGLILPGQPDPERKATNLILSDGPEPDRKQVVNHVGEEVSSMTWAKYIALRTKTCKPRITNPDALFKIDGQTEDAMTERVRSDMLEDLNQATLEFVGECAELSELFFGNGCKLLYGDPRVKLIDECGDILFTGTWAIDAWARNPAPPNDYDLSGNNRYSLDELWARAYPDGNPLQGMDDTELFRVTDDDVHAQIAQHVLSSGGMKLAKDRKFVQIATSAIGQQVAMSTMLSGLTANAYKKLQYQRREQDIKLQIQRVANVFMAVNTLLIMANSSIEEAMIVNRAKLDNRYPGGYRTGQGGGIRNEG